MSLFSLSKTPISSPRLLDQITILLSALFFYLNSAVVSYATRSTDLSAGYFTFARSFLGTIAIGLVILRKRPEPPKESLYLCLRGLANFVALMTYFEAVAQLGPALGNTLNLTYPLFLAFFAFRTGDDARTAVGTVASAGLAFAAILLILQPGTGMYEFKSVMLGLLSGMTGAVAVASLRRARALNGPETVLLFLFGISLPLSLIFFWRELYWPSLVEFNLLFWGSLTGLIGQYLFTFGSKHLSATESGVISQSRILIAAVAGYLLGLDPPLTVLAMLGIAMIFLVNVYLVCRQSQVAE